MNKLENLIVGTEDFVISLWDKFDEIMKKEKYELFVNTDEPNIPRGTICFNSKDKYAPIIALNVWENMHVSIFVQNRNGNACIDGNTVSINALKFTKEDVKEDVEKRFNDMITCVLEKYKIYNEQNRLDLNVDKNNIERIDW